MLIKIPNILTSIECSAVCDALKRDKLWKDGKATAAGSALEVKSNLQADPKAAAVRGSVEKIKKAISANQTFKIAAQPAEFARVMINRFDDGMAYGSHVDAAYMNGIRCDLSFTVFLTDPAAYDGGELMIETVGGELAVKGDEGSMILYPSNAIHRVEPVRSGSRIACVGWVRSRIREQEVRENLLELERILGDMPKGPLRLRVVNVRNNLLRFFGE